ncbi:MAG: CpaF family protein, partial [Chloroflexi bacterium]|nr:CpaF family protein [Chloroflexota bacterium]
MDAFLTPAAATQGHDITVIEDDALRQLGNEDHRLHQQRATLIGNPTVLAAVRDVLERSVRHSKEREQQTALRADDDDTPVAHLREVTVDLDPFSPAQQRQEQVCVLLRQEIDTQTYQGGPLARVPTDEDTLLALYNETLGWGPIQPYLDDPNIQEVKIIGNVRGVYVLVQESGSDFQQVEETFPSVESVLRRAILTATILNTRLDSATPQATLPLSNATRMHVSIPPRVDDGVLVSIRRGRLDSWDVDDLVERKALTAEIAALLRLFCAAGCSFLIGGSTGSGKTAWLEALMNSWPGSPHVVTIEDGMREINCRHPIWTPELVNTQVRPDDYARAAVEALRQTPSIVAPGETRSFEAGAILYLATTDHAVLTTIHAETATEALTGFARRAADPKAFQYDQKPQMALEDTCLAFTVVIHLAKLSGKRFVREIALANGVTYDEAGQMRPNVIPLVRGRVNDESGDVVWDIHATVQDRRLVWNDPAQQTPERIQEKLQRARIRRAARANVTQRRDLEAMIGQAQALLASQAAPEALALLERAWAIVHDPRILGYAQQALARDNERWARLHEETRQRHQGLEQIMRYQQWDIVQQHLTAILNYLPTAAAYQPPGGWPTIQQLSLIHISEPT